MAEIIPRWEWRVFGTEHQAAEDGLAALSPWAREESDEVYVLSAANSTVKIRHGQMDVKLLREVDGDGLQRWEPVMKQGFPLERDDVAAVLDALGVDAASWDAVSGSQFLAQLIESSDAVRVVNVHKARVRYRLGGCLAEIAGVLAEGRSTRTIAVESEDPAAVVGVRRELGLEGHPNTSYPQGLAAVVADLPPRYAVIDLGTNSVKFRIAERSTAGWRTIVDRADVTRLGEGLEADGTIQPEPLERTTLAIATMAEEAMHHGVRAFAALGTAGLRKAENRDEVIATIRERTGVTVEAISGDEESRLGYLAAQAGLGAQDGSLAVFETGGGSSQFTFGRGPVVDERFSVPLGAVRLTEQFGLDGVVDSAVLAEALKAISAELAVLDDRPHPDTLIAMGGAVTNMTAVMLGLTIYDPDRVHGTVLPGYEIDRQIELYRTEDADGRRDIIGLQPNRAEVILAGACVVRTVMDKLGRPSLTVSDRGIRHAVLEERFPA